MSTTTDTPTRTRLPRLDVGIRPLPDHAYAISPKAVQQASDEYAAALARHAEAKAQVRAARAAVEVAAEQDRQGDLHALREGTDPPDTIEHLAIAEAKAAERRTHSTETIAREALAAMLAAIVENADVMRAKLREEADKRASQALAAAEELEAAVLRRDSLHIALSALTDTDYLLGARPMLDLREPRHLSGPLREGLDQLRQRLTDPAAPAA
jgi:hypothetical protein